MYGVAHPFWQIGPLHLPPYSDRRRPWLWRVGAPRRGRLRRVERGYDLDSQVAREAGFLERSCLASLRRDVLMAF
jgi:hypothetical protein